MQTRTGGKDADRGFAVRVRRARLVRRDERTTWERENGVANEESRRTGGEMRERRGGNLWAVGRGWRATTTRPTTRASGLAQFTVSPAADGRRASGRSGAKARDSSERLEQRHIAALAWAMATPSASQSGVLICPRALPQRATGRLAGGQQAGRQVVFSLVAYDGVLSAAPQRRQGPWYESMEVSTSC